MLQKITTTYSGSRLSEVDKTSSRPFRTPLSLTRRGEGGEVLYCIAMQPTIDNGNNHHE